MKVAAYILCLAVILMGFSGPVLAQSVISAKAGQINYLDGKVFLEDKEVLSKGGLFPQMKTNQELKTEDSRAEVLLSPGVFLRVGENSRIKMLSDRLEDTRLELFSGSIIVEGGALVKGDTVTLVHKNAVVTLVRNGLYRLDSEPAQLRVYDGEALVEQAGQTATVKKAHLLLLNGLMLAEKFDNKTGDALYRWARRRAEDLAMANPSAARSASYRGLLYNSWLYNPDFGMFTFVPCRGVYTSFWGYQYWSPTQVWSVYNPSWPSNSGGYSDSSRAYSSSGYTGMASTSSGTSGASAVSSTPSTASTTTSVAVGGASGNAGGSHR